jgi:hypothetical protein
VSPTIPAFVIAGALWIVRGALATADPDYYDPTTAVDYASVVTYSLALGATAIALLLFVWRGAVRVPGAARASLIVSAMGGIVAGLANFGEDWLGVSALSWAYVVAVLPFYLGLTAAGFILVARSRELRWVGALMLVPFFAPLLGPAVGYVLGGASLIACAALFVRRSLGRVPATA